MIVKITDIRATGHCTLGIRRWFDSRGIDFHDFMRNGIEAERLLETGDGLAKRVVTAIENRKEAKPNG
jgi:hypothetical protein